MALYHPSSVEGRWLLTNMTPPSDKDKVNPHQAVWRFHKIPRRAHTLHSLPQVLPHLPHQLPRQQPKSQTRKPQRNPPTPRRHPACPRTDTQRDASRATVRRVIGSLRQLSERQLFWFNAVRVYPCRHEQVALASALCFLRAQGFPLESWVLETLAHECYGLV